ncbi:hypothetical protein H6P81_011249 [Aristolochia fimbriata]|uniref:PDZ domain-containing protein n=1 Tax=Aristolochia fimbriata TaxID=158543 RepID=A0AAV7ES92_ARIFI|nr:hypothetical protein H6P81_011249 [Aristolochia fimbriata]
MGLGRMASSRCFFSACSSVFWIKLIKYIISTGHSLAKAGRIPCETFRSDISSQMLASACISPLQCNRRETPKRVGRREVFVDGVSSIYCRRDEQTNDEDDAFSRSVSIHRLEDGSVKYLGRMVRQSTVPLTTRRMFATTFFSLCCFPSRYFSALALGDSSVTVEEVTPPVFPPGPLFPTEERVVKLFERNTNSVVNIFDITLRPQLNVTGVVEVPEGNGSGVVWDEQGHIVTNYHVVGNALSRNPSPGQVVARVNILVSEGLQKSFEGKLIGADRAKDLAVLKVEASKDLLNPIKVGSSSSLRVGQQCLAIGNPFGFDHTLTVGVISGLNRDISSRAGITIAGGVQTDAAINPGNSGGPLLDSKGSLIGINTAIFTQTGTSAGVGFAIPSSTVLKIVPQLIQFGKVVRASLNVEIAPDLVANQLNVRNGALVMQVPGNSSAAKAGLLPTSRGFAGNIILGDIITAIDEKSVKNKGDLSNILDDYSVGDKVLLEIVRGNQSLELPVVLEESQS